MKAEYAPDFSCAETETIIACELLPVLEKIASVEFKAVTILNPDIDESDIADMDTSIRMIEAIVSGYLKCSKEMYLNYGRKLSALLGSDNKRELNDSINALMSN